MCFPRTRDAAWRAVSIPPTWSFFPCTKEHRNNGAADKTTIQTAHAAPSPLHVGMGLSFFSNASASTSPFSVVSELRSLPVQGTVLVSHGNIPKNAHGLAIPVRRRPWPRDKPLLFFGALAMHVFRAVQIVQQ